MEGVSLHFYVFLYIRQTLINKLKEFTFKLKNKG